MKKTKMIGLWALALLTMLTLFNVRTMAALPDDDPQNKTLPDDFRARYRASTQKIVTGYHIEYYGFFGAPFSRIVKEYTMEPCCDFTGNIMDGCSGVKNCKR